MSSLPPALLVDSTSGKLCRWLRLWGIDTGYHPGTDPAPLFQRARRERRLVVSRSSRVRKWAPSEVIQVTGDELDEQLRQVVRELIHRSGELRPLTRCSECNQPVRSMRREDARGMVPPYVWRTQRSFSCCPSCGRIYWEATHGRGIRSRLARLVEELGTGDEESPG